MNRTRSWLLGLTAIVVTFVFFVIPFIFIFLTASKERRDASELQFSWPEKFQFWENITEVLKTRNGIVITAFINSTILTVVSVALMVVFGAMVGYVLQRRPSKWNKYINALVLAGLIVPPAVVPTIWVMQSLGIFKTLPGLMLVEAAFGMSFSILMFRAFIATLPREIDEAALVDGASPLRLFFQIILPLLRPVVITVVVVQSVFVFNDFQNPLYFLPGDKNATVQLTLFKFQSQFNTSWNLLFADILLITLPMLIMYIFFNRQIVAGLTSGAVKG